MGKAILMAEKDREKPGEYLDQIFGLQGLSMSRSITAQIMALHKLDKQTQIDAKVLQAPAKPAKTSPKP